MAAKLTPAKAMELKRNLADGMPVVEAARFYGLAADTVRKIKRGEIWGKVGEAEVHFRPIVQPSADLIAASLMKVQHEINPMVDEPTDAAKDAAEAALDERIRLFRMGDELLDELTGKEKKGEE